MEGSVSALIWALPSQNVDEGKSGRIFFFFSLVVFSILAIRIKVIDPDPLCSI